jgi:long-chain acyl-CoA synthetase
MSAEFDTATAANILRARTVRGVAPDLYMVPFASIADMLETRARAVPNQPLLTYYDDDAGLHEAWSYAEFDARVNQMANFLAASCGVRRGDRVATVAHNHPDTVLAYFACWKIGATVTPQNIGEDDARIGFILKNAEAQVLLARPEYHQRVERIRASAPNITLVVLDDELRAQLDQQPATFVPLDPPNLEDECLLVYTSGTTGAPKGVQLIQYNLLVDAKGIADWQSIDATQRLMCILPIHHVNGIEVTLITPIYAGGSIVLNRGFKATTFWRRLAEERVTIVSVVPTILQFLLEAGEDIRAHDLSRFRHFICGAGTLSVTLAERFEQHFGQRILHGYGLSETTCYSCFLPTDLSDTEHHDWMRAHGYPSIGVPIGPNEMAIHDQEGHELADGEKGEIVIRGHNVMIGYFQRPDANAETFRHGWFRSGDEGLALRDSQGRQFFFITGRLKELINRGGVKYSPFEIEEVLMQLPGVRVGLAVAFDNSYYGEEVGAYVVLDAGAELTEAQVLAHCRARMPFTKAPKVVIFGTEAPVTSTGKFQRLRLKDHFAPWAETQFKETRR